MRFPTRTLRKLALLTVAVIWAHSLMLEGLPQSLGWLQTTQDTAAEASSAFVTRSIPAVVPAPVAPAAAPPVVAKVRPQAAIAPSSPSIPVPESETIASPSEPVSKTKQPETLVDTAQTAPELVAVQPSALPPAKPPGTADPLAAAAYTAPAPVRIQYDVKGEVKGFPYSANANLLWLQDGKTYDARLEISHFLLGSRVQTSKGQLSAQGLEPIRFGDKVRSEVAAHFQRDKGKVTFSANSPDVDLLPGAQDQLSVLLQLTTMLGSDPARYTNGTQIAFQAVGPRSAEHWVFTVGSLEKIALLSGEMEGLKFTRPPVSEFEPRLEVWFGPEVAYLPIRVRLSQSNGDFADQLWRGAQKP